MRELLTPKQVARAIGASESSVKRWCDAGTIDTQYTAGGHRRIPMSGLLEFLRDSKYRLREPEILGLPATVGRSGRVVGRSRSQLTDAILAGAEDRCRHVAIDLYLAEHSLSTICDEVLAESFREVGKRWECGDAEVYQERRGCEMVKHLLTELRTMIASPPAGAPVAIGGAVSGDHYELATAMVELVLRDNRWNAHSLGHNLPFETLAAAIKDHRPRLFWISCSHIVDESEFLSGYRQLYDELGADVAFVVGGRALHEGLRREMNYAAYCENLRRLEDFAQSLWSPSNDPDSGG